MLLSDPDRSRPGALAAPGRVRLAAAVVVLVVAVLAVAWSATARPGSTATAPDRPEHPLAELRSLPPIYQMTSTWSAPGERISRAQRRLVVDCMARHGFTYAPPEPATAAEMAAGWSSPFGLESLDGGVVGGGPGPVEVPRGEAFDRALHGDPDRRVSASGHRISVSRPATGCLAEAERRLLGNGRRRWIEVSILLGEAEIEALRRLERDPAFLDATARWRRCVESAEVRSRDPLELLASLPAGTDLATSPAARADVRCKLEVGYLASGYGALATLQRELLDGEPGLAEDWADLRRRQDAAAREVLGDG